MKAIFINGSPRKNKNTFKMLEGAMNGANPKEVQELLGHSDVSTTMNIYAHSSQQAKHESAMLLDKIVS